MSKEERNKVVPRLRFPEFKGSEGWLVMRLEEILLEGKLGGNYENSDANSGVPVIKMGNLERGSINVEKLQYLPNDSEYNEADVLKRSDLLLNTRNTLELVGKVAIWKTELPKALYNSNLLRLTFHRDAIASNYFMNYCFNTQSMLGAIRSIATGTTSVAAIYTKDLLKLELSIPNPKEQQKIADFLFSLDELITAENGKLEALKAHKKGLMQQLFPAEGETVPKLRFAEFRDSGEWRVKKLDEVCEVNPSIEKLPDNFLYIDLESVEDGMLLKKKFINVEGAPSRAQRLLKMGDVIFQTVRPYQKNNYLFYPKDNFNYVASTGYAQLRAYESEMYLYQYLHSQVFVDKVLEKSTGTNYPAINSTDLSHILIMIPKPKEQQKIADCLSSLDELIMEQAQKIEALTQHKKGLLQGLFPGAADT